MNNKRNIAGWVSLFITLILNLLTSDAWVKEALNVTLLPVMMWAIVDWLRKEVPGFDDKLGGQAPFFTALVLAFALPGLAYLAQSFVFQTVPFTWNGFGAAVGVGMTVASTIHHGTKEVEEATVKA